MSVLAEQLTSEVEVLTELDDGTRSIGEKRNALVESAGGEYVCFVDDDDMVSSDYVGEDPRCDPVEAETASECTCCTSTTEC